MASNSHWLIGPIKTPRLQWGERWGQNAHQCCFCGLALLMGKHTGFCCGSSGQYLNDTPPLPPLPLQYTAFLSHLQISSLSRVLNLIFSFASMETTHQFPHANGPLGFFAIQGHVYHRVQPNHPNSAVQWFLYDGFIHDKAPHLQWAETLPSHNLETRLNYIHANQKRLQEEDTALMGKTYVSNNQNIYLPPSFLGSNKWASEQIADSLAITATYGAPTFFVTMTCNTNWPEIQSRLCPGQDFTDIFTVVIHVIRQKLTLLEETLSTMFPNAGHLLYMVHSVEFQKWGLPYVHILLKFEQDCIHPDDIDSVVDAEIPEDIEDAQLVHSFMIHNHPPLSREPSKYCQHIDNKGEHICCFNYPHPLQQNTTIDIEGRAHYRRRKPNDKMVVPHCLPLLRKFQCHLNFEVANSSHLFQYLFKYIHKGN